jgi:hypothetical protein
VLKVKEVLWMELKRLPECRRYSATFKKKSFQIREEELLLFIVNLKFYFQLSEICSTQKVTFNGMGLTVTVKFSQLVKYSVQVV